jgi:putative endonuclease
MNSYWVYILCSKRNGTLYVGVTNNLIRRVYEHKQKLIDGFTKKYDINKLIYTEEFNDVYAAIYREKCIKKWNRSWKLKLIEQYNPEWEDLYVQMFTEEAIDVIPSCSSSCHPRENGDLELKNNTNSLYEKNYY